VSSDGPSLPDSLRELSDPVRVFRLLLLAAQQLRYLMDRRLAAADLTTQQAMLLTMLDMLGGSALLGEAADKLMMTHQNVKQLAVSLESKDFVSIEIDERDRRARRVKPTAKSRRFWRQRDQDDHAAVASWMSELSPDELATLSRLLLKLVRHVEPTCRAVRAGQAP